MTPVETLREAARLMRERAKAATTGPWTSAVVALAVADWLDIEASYGGEQVSGQRHQALAVARSYLGQP